MEKTEKTQDIRLCSNCGGRYMDGTNTLVQCCLAPMLRKALTLHEAYAVLAAKAQRGSFLALAAESA